MEHLDQEPVHLKVKSGNAGSWVGALRERMFLARYLVDNHHDVHGVGDDLDDGGDGDGDVREDCQSKSKSSVREESLRKRRAMMLAGEQKVIMMMMKMTVMIMMMMSNLTMMTMVVGRWKDCLEANGACQRATSATSVQSQAGESLII